MNNKIIGAAVALILASSQFGAVNAAWNDSFFGKGDKESKKELISATGTQNICDIFENVEKKALEAVATKSKVLKAIQTSFSALQQCDDDLVDNYFKDLEELFEALRKPLSVEKLTEKIGKFRDARSAMREFIASCEANGKTLAVSSAVTTMLSAMESASNYLSKIQVKDGTVAGSVAKEAIVSVIEDTQAFYKLAGKASNVQSAIVKTEQQAAAPVAASNGRARGR